ncbi:hypothetical protein D9615_001096 [Tricholomella constricta]|uniref:Uncharacterized protein n=1 Tax=Tricholomella constricta TaxID=117010 RepID=A0A8H5M8U0_9AGAR|nr:hypothetical protein D9615_001096 [Tricholomella constricta]
MNSASDFQTNTIAWDITAPEHMEERAALFAQSAEYYIRAADQFYTDKTKFLKVALEFYWFGKAPFRMTLPLWKRIREAIPDMKKSGNIRKGKNIAMDGSEWFRSN